MSKLFFNHALLPGGWTQNVVVTVSGDGVIETVEAGGAPDGAPDGDIALPGLPNMHSHAFQRAIAGRTERKVAGENSFWSWRQAMYHFLDRLTPDHVAAIAAQAYMEMLETGSTTVGEFHYLHHDRDGAPYANLAAMGEAVIAAAGETGIGLTLLPVFYAQSGFGGQAPEPAQRRFINDADRFLKLAEACETATTALPAARTGFAPHSLRAVTEDGLRAVLEARPDGPVHIHIAEQMREVEDCRSWSGQRPVEWLLDHFEVDERWTLIHATHMTGAESRGAAEAGAVICVCPITEANLGDGIFDGPTFLNAGGRIAIGSDSNVLISATEELRWLEYSQRLRDRARNVLIGDAASTGRALFDAAARGGAQSSGQAVGALQAGNRADIVTLDADHAALAGDGWLDGWIFGGGGIDKVWTGGQMRVSGGRHRDRGAIQTAYRKAVADLTA